MIFPSCLEQFEATNRRCASVSLLKQISRLNLPQTMTANFGVTNRVLHENLAIWPDNQIQCAGPLPDFPIPEGWDQHDFASNQALCATQLSGGNPAANAGGYCHRTGPSYPPTAERVVSFADDQTPRLDWTWSGQSGSNFRSSAAIRFHCWKNCLCNVRNPTKNYLDPQVRMWEWVVENLPQDFISIGKGNRYPMGSSTDKNGRPRTTSRGGSVRSAECAADPNRPGRCELPWPTDILGPVPAELMKIALRRQPAAIGSEPNAPTADPNRSCGNGCHSNNDCGTDCLCRMPSILEAKALGVDPVAPRALCLDVASVFGRSLESQGQIGCLCNATYIAPECCHSRDGEI